MYHRNHITKQPYASNKISSLYSKKFVDQLENLLLAQAEQCPDHGMTILYHLLGFTTPASGGASSEAWAADRASSGPFSFHLLSKLCQPTSDIARQRYG